MTASTRAGTAATDAVDEILSGYQGLQAAQEAFYKDLHAHPELSHHEHRTARCVAGERRPSSPPCEPAPRPWW